MFAGIPLPNNSGLNIDTTLVMTIEDTLLGVRGSGQVTACVTYYLPTFLYRYNVIKMNLKRKKVIEEKHAAWGMYGMFPKAEGPRQSPLLYWKDSFALQNDPQKPWSFQLYILFSDSWEMTDSMAQCKEGGLEAKAPNSRSEPTTWDCGQVV